MNLVAICMISAVGCSQMLGGMSSCFGQQVACVRGCLEEPVYLAVLQYEDKSAHAGTCYWYLPLCG
jgi:hypothetical protein